MERHLEHVSAGDERGRGVRDVVGEEAPRVPQPQPDVVVPRDLAHRDDAVAVAGAATARGGVAVVRRRRAGACARRGLRLVLRRKLEATVRRRGVAAVVRVAVVRVAVVGAAAAGAAATGAAAKAGGRDEHLGQLIGERPFLRRMPTVNTAPDTGAVIRKKALACSANASLIGAPASPRRSSASPSARTTRATYARRGGYAAVAASAPRRSTASTNASCARAWRRGGRGWRGGGAAREEHAARMRQGG